MVVVKHAEAHATFHHLVLCKRPAVHRIEIPGQILDVTAEPVFFTTTPATTTTNEATSILRSVNLMSRTKFSSGVSGLHVGTRFM